VTAVVGDKLVSQAIADDVVTELWIYLSAHDDRPKNRDEPPEHWPMQKCVNIFDTYGRTVVSRHELEIPRDASDRKSTVQLLAERAAEPLVNRDLALQQITKRSPMTILQTKSGTR
jgi:hypothetical protein